MSLLVIFVVSTVTLGLEILLTRVFSVVLFASHSFLAIGRRQTRALMDLYRTLPFFWENPMPSKGRRRL